MCRGESRAPAGLRHRAAKGREVQLILEAPPRLCSLALFAKSAASQHRPLRGRAGCGCSLQVAFARWSPTPLVAGRGGAGSRSVARAISLA